MPILSLLGHWEDDEQGRRDKGGNRWGLDEGRTNSGEGIMNVES